MKLKKKSGVYFVKAHIAHEVKGTVEAVMQDKGSQNSCVRAEGSQNSCVRAEGSQNSCVRTEGLQISYVRAEGLPKHRESCVEFEEQKLCKRNDAVVEDPVDDHRIPAEAGADMILAPCEPSESEK